MEQKQISELQPGDILLSFFVVRKKEFKIQQKNREPYLTFEFGDSSGRIRGSVWDDPMEINEAIQIGDIVKVKGRVITYHDGPHISIEKIRKVLPEDQVEPMQFLPKAEKNIDEMYEALLKIIVSIGNTQIQALLNRIFTDEKIKDQFTKAPAAKLMHHNYLGGLLEHTLSIARLCDVLHQHYPMSNRDILLAGALLHDLGKMTELKTAGFIDYSTRGRLIGHITISAQMVTDALREIEGFPENLKDQILHCILSHHGQKEYGSPVLPMTLEALLLNYADEIDARVAAFLRIMKKDKEPGREWSNFDNVLDRFIYLGEEDEK